MGKLKNTFKKVSLLKPTPGSTQSHSLTRGTDELLCPRCYVCDQHIQTRGMPLLNAILPFSKLALPQKIGKLVGDNFMVLVSIEDLICMRCSNLFNQLDSLEMETDKITNELVNFLKIRYKITDNFTQSHLPHIKIEQLRPADKGVKRKIEEVQEKRIERQQEIEIQLSEMFGTPVKISPSSSNKRKTTPIQKCSACKFQSHNTSEFKTHIQECKYMPFKCPICKKGFNNRNLLRDHFNEEHLSQYKCQKCKAIFDNKILFHSHKTLNSCHGTDLKELITKGDIKLEKVKKFKCAICSQKFEFKELLTAHLKKHKTSYFKCGTCAETFQHRDILMKHLETHIKIKSNQPNPSQDSSTESLLRASIEEALRVDPDGDAKSKDQAKEIKFLDCTTCALSYIDNDRYSSHLNSHRKLQINDTKKPVKVEEESVDTSNHIDLEGIFEKLHSDHTESKQSETHVESPENNVISLLSDNIPSYNNNNSELSENKLEDIHESDLITKKIIVYKCSICDDLYDNSDNLQIHLLTSGHGDLNSEIEILELRDSSNVALDESGSIKLLQSEENNMHLLSIDDAVKEAEQEKIKTADKPFDSSDDNVKIITLNESHDGDTDNLQLLTSSDGREIKFISFHSKFEQMGNHPENVSYVGMEGLENENHQIVSPCAEVFHLNSNEIISSETHTSSPTHTEITELLQNVVNNAPVTQNIHAYANKTKVHIIGEETVDVAQFISTKSGLQGQFNLEELCNLNIKSEMHAQNQNLSDSIQLHVTDKPLCENTSYLTKSSAQDSNIINKDQSQRKLYKCSKCEFQCFTHEIIKAHMSKHASAHVSELTAASDTMSVKEINAGTNIQTTKSGPVECKLCKQTFKSLALLNRHKNTFHRKPVCTYCNKRMKNIQALKIHEQRHSKAGDVCVCDDCGKQFKTKCSLNNHKTVHTGNYKFFCGFCNRGYNSRVVLEEHKAKHTKEERIVCDICGKKFQFKSTYWIHRKWHDNPFPYKCNYCNRKFRHTSLLAVHKRKHTGERPYKCPHCSLSFPVSGTLKRHLILHTGAFPYTCELCDRGFTTRHQYAIHQSKMHGDSKLLNETLTKQREFKMVIRDNTDVVELPQEHRWTNTEEIELDTRNDMVVNCMIANADVLMNTSDSGGEVVLPKPCDSTSSILNDWYDHVQEQTESITSLHNP